MLKTYSDKLIDQVATSIHNNAENAASIPVLKYALDVIFNFFVVTTIVLVICSISGHFWPGVIGLIVMPLLRYFSGGLHLRSSLACSYLSAAMIVLAVHTYQWLPYWNWGFILNVIALLLVVIYAPAGIKGHSRLDEKHYPKLKLVASVLVLVNFAFGSSLVAMLIFMQGVTLPLTKLEKSS